MHEYVGGIHIHSNYSDGLKPINEIAGIALSSGLDFLMFTDHRTLQPLKMGMERWFGPVLSIVGYEHNDPDNRNHYLVFGLDEILPPDLAAQEYVRRVNELGGLGFIAHPDEKRSAMPEHPPYPWTAWDAEGYTGIEIWNHSSEWLEGVTHANKYFRVLHPLKNLTGPYPETLRRWDMLNRTRAVPGIGGIDAHAYPYRFGPLTIYIFRYKVLFKGVRTHLLMDEPMPEELGVAKAAVFDALKNARCFISNRRWGDARGFRFNARADGTTGRMGDTVRADGAEFSITVPSKGDIALVRDGETVMNTRGRELTLSCDMPGAYRVEVRRRGKPWILSNHIRLKGTDTDD